jgi:hypothetical protein
MLYTIALILTFLLLVSPLAAYLTESEVHSLLVIAILGVLIRGIQSNALRDRSSDR